MAGNIIFYCFGGAHSSVVTAAIFLGLVDAKKVPTSEELLLIPYYDQQRGHDHGKMRLMGEDSDGNRVYIVGKRNLNGSFEKIINEFLSINKIDDNKPTLVDTLPGVNLPMRIGGFVSRKLGLIALGRPLVIWGTKKAYKNFAKMATTLDKKNA